MIPNPCIEVQTFPEARPSVPPWFAEMVIIARHLTTHDLLDAFAQQIRLVRGRFGTYEPIDFLALLVGYAISGERTLYDFFERITPFETAFMALFGRRCLPHRSSLSRFLADVDRPCLEAFRTLFEQQTFAEGWTAETIGGIFDRQGRRYIVFDVDATRQAARQRALPCDPTLPAARRRLDAVCAPGYTGRKLGEVVRTRTTALQMHTRQWIGTYGGKGNGDYRGELASALRAITTYLTHFAFPAEVALVRLDGQYGDAAVIAQLMLAGVYLVTRGRGYQLLEYPQIQRILAHPPTASVTASNTGVIVDLFEGGWLELGAGLPHARVVVARHPAPPADKKVRVGKRVDEWVYERFITTLDADGFLVEDVLDLYHGRGAFEGVLADEDVEGDPDRWCSYTECGQELWQIACQWVWNLRLTLGKMMQGGELREMEWAPPKEAPAVFVAEGPSPQEYGPWQWAAAFGRATGLICAEDARVARGREAALPSRGQPVVERSARVRMPLRKLAVYVAYQTDCQPCPLREQCLASGAKGDRARRVTAVSRLLPPPAPVPVERKPILLGPIRWVDVGRVGLGEHFAAPG